MIAKKKGTCCAALLLLLFMTAGNSPLQAQTTLATGDISFIGFNSALSSRDGFAFVSWVDLSSGTVIKFTDNGFNSSSSSNTAGNLRDQEQTATWTATSAVTKGTVITIEGNGSSSLMVANIGSVMVANATGAGTNTLNLANQGDQLFAFQGSYTSANSTAGTFSGTLLYGVGFQGIGAATNWLTTGSTGSYTSYLPADLTGNELFFGSMAVAAEYTGARTGLTIAQFKAAINNLSNWTTYSNPNGVTAYNTTTFSTGAAPSITGQPSAAAVCAGDNTSFSITTSDATGYQWQVNTGSGFSNVSNGGVYSGATTATLSITGATAGMNGYLYRCIASGSVSPDATSNSATLTVSVPGTWLGGTSAAWDNSANWSCSQVPGASTDVVIPSGTSFSPLINTTAATCNDLTINSGATLAFSGSTNIIDIKGDVTNDGTFNTALGKVILSGTSQTIPGIAYTDLELNGTGIKALTDDASVSGTLTLTTGFLQTGSYDLTLGNAATISGASLSSFVIINGTGSLFIQNIGSGGKTGSQLFPVGTSSVSYTPLQIDNSSGTADVFGVRVISAVYDSYDGTDNPDGTVQTSNNVDKTWLVTEGVAGGSNATISFTWYSTDEQPGFDRDACFPGHYTGGAWYAASTVMASGTDPYSVSMTGVTSFSPFAVGSANSALPLQLLSFSGKRINQDVLLTWQTANEVNVDKFEVERSADGGHFVTAGFMEALNNNTGSSISYNYRDSTAPATSVYYRLKMLDADGSFRYSAVIAVTPANGTQRLVTLYPNPVTGNQLQVQLSNRLTGKIQLRITDMTGRIYQTVSGLAGGTIRLPVTALPPGLYQLEVTSTAGQQIIPFVKQR